MELESLVAEELLEVSESTEETTTASNDEVGLMMVDIKVAVGDGEKLFQDPVLSASELGSLAKDELVEGAVVSHSSVSLSEPHESARMKSKPKEAAIANVPMALRSGGQKVMTATSAGLRSNRKNRK